MDGSESKEQEDAESSEITVTSRETGSVQAGSLWDVNDVILGQAGDESTQKGLVRISAFVDSGQVAPENMAQWIPLKSAAASMAG